MKNQKRAIRFWNFVCGWEPWQNFEGEKSYATENLKWHIKETEGRKKLKFDEVSTLQICQKFLRKNGAKIFSSWMRKNLECTKILPVL